MPARISKNKYKSFTNSKNAHIALGVKALQDQILNTLKISFIS